MHIRRNLALDASHCTVGNWLHNICCMFFIFSGETLFPDESSELGKQVRQLCKRLDMVEMDIITYGIIYHPHLSEAGCQISGAEQRSMRG